VGEDHVCGFDGVDVLCWGSNGYGQLGVPLATFDSRFAIPIQGGLGFIAVAAGGNEDGGAEEGGFTCGLDQDFLGIHCWGRMGASGSASTTPVPVTGLPAEQFVSLTAGDAHACALAADGAVYCWGENGKGQLGNGSSTSSDMVAVPVTVTGELVGGAFVTLSAGGTHTCGIVNEALRLRGTNEYDDPFPGNGAIYCWGDNEVGQLGNGPSAGNSSVPVRVLEPAP